MGDTLTLRSIEFTNFRNFADGRLDLDEQLTVLVADNGGGKTAALDAISVALAAIVPGVRGRRRKDSPPQRGLDLAPSDAHSAEVLPPYEYAAYPVGLRCEGELRGELASWECLLEGADQPARSEFAPAAAGFSKPAVMAQRPPVDLPVVAYYGTSRATGSVNGAKMPNLGRIERGLGYKNALTPNANYAEVTAWLAQTEWERTSTRGTPWESVLLAIYEATTSVLASLGAKSVFYSLEERDLAVEFDLGDEQSRIAPMSLVSDGFRSVIALVADLAFRCGALNAHFDSDATQLTDGVVLIDEIDMHLHPRWQAHVLADLVRTFPRVQFVVTTHSPLVISSIDSAQVRTISAARGTSSFERMSRQTKGADIEYITEAVFDAPTRGDADFARDLELLSRLLAEGDLDGASEPAQRVRSRLGNSADFDADRLLREFDWRLSRSTER